MRPRAEIAETAIKQVEALGFDAGDVRRIVATHLDPDHSGGLPDFPDAEVHVFARELEAALDPQLRERPRYSRSPLAHGPNWVRHEVEGDDWFGFEGVRILPGTGAEIAAGPARRPLARPLRRRDQDRRGLAAALRRRLLPPRRGRHPPPLPARPALLPAPQRRRPQAAQGEPGAAARAGLPPRRRDRPDLLARPALYLNRERRRAGEALGAAVRRAGRELAPDRVHALARGRARPGLRRLRRALALVGRGPRGLLVLDLGLLRGPRRRRRRARSSARTRCPAPSWFEGTSLNYAEHVFAGKDDAEIAILHASELRELGRAELGRAARPGRRRRRRPARRSGSSAATASSPTCRTSPRRSSPSSPPPRSAPIWSSCSPDFGPASVVDRFAQIEPKVLFAVDGYGYGGKRFDRREVLAELQAAMPTLERTVVLPYLEPDPDLSPLRDAIAWDELAPQAARAPSSSSSGSPSTTRSGSSTPRGRPGCRKRSSRARAGSCSST